MKLPKSILLTLLYFISLELIGFWIFLIPEETQYLDLLKASHLINTLATLIILIIVFKLIKRPDLLTLKRTKNKFYFFGILLGIGFVFFQSFLNIVYYLEVSTDIFNYNFTLDRLTSLNVMASIMFVPITEELFFRNYLLGGLLKNYKPLIAIVITSLLFAFIHIPFVSLFYEFMEFSFHQAYIAIFGGVISGMLFYKSKSIIPSIIFHVIWNLVSYVL
jgi:membrane protease YdiL (CAAX protease family)